MELKVDIKGQLRLYRSNTFSDPYAFFAEALQNAQRARAQKVWIRTGSDEVVIEDNGPGLDDPNSIFTIASSGWSDEVKEEQDPFGIGFFSALALADLVIIESKGRKYTLDYPAILSGEQEGDVREDTTDYDQGFKVTLQRLVPAYDRWVASSRAKEVASTIIGIQIEVNDNLVETIDPLIPPAGKLVAGISWHGVKGWLAFAHYSWDSSLKVYHENRFVTTMHLSGIEGAISVSRKVINLRAPDRRDIIRDSQYDNLIERLKSTFKGLAYRKLASGARITDMEMSTIQQYLKPEEYVSVLSYSTLTSAADLDRLDKYSDEDLRGLDPEALDRLLYQPEAEEMIQVEEAQFQTKDFESFQPKHTMKPSKTEVQTIPAPSIEELVEQAARETKAIGATKSDKALVRRFKTAARNNKLYYAEPTDLKQHKDMLRELLNTGATVVVARNRLELDSLKEGLNATYAGAVEKETTYRYSFQSKDTSVLTQRVCRLVGKLIQAYDLDLVPVPGNLTREVEVTLNGTRASLTKGPISFATDPMVDNKYLYVSTQAEKERILRSYDERTDLGELLYILRHLDELATALGLSPSKVAAGLGAIKTNWMITQTVAEEAENE